LLKKKKLLIKSARVGDQRIEYFRIDDLTEAVEKNKDAIKLLLNNPNEEPIDIIKNEALWYLTRPLNAKKLKYPPVL
jgi:hypothetical protein